MSLLRRDFLRLSASGLLAAGAAGSWGGAAPSRGEPGKAAPGEARAEDDLWAMVRAQYPLDEGRVHLNAGGLGPAPYPVLDAVHRARMDLQRVSEAGRERIEAARAPVAAFLGADADEIAFTRNATEGNSTVASGLDLDAGDEVVFESHAHPGGAMPWMNRQKQDGVRVRVFEPHPTRPEETLARLEALLTPATKVVQVSHVTAPTGLRLPVGRIAALARKRGLWFHVDGAQSAGMVPVDLHAIGCDSYATSGHKWLGATPGTGLLYVRRDRLDAVAPTEVGAYTNDAYRLPDAYTYHPSARRFEAGTRDAAAVEGVLAAVRFHEGIGVERVDARTRRLAARLKEGLRSVEGVEVLTPDAPALCAGMTAFRSDRLGHRALVRRLLDEHGLRCRPVDEQGLDAVRVSTHVYNRPADCDRVVEAVRALTAA